MSYTKRQIVQDAYAELAIAGWVWDLTADELQWGARVIDRMAGTWDGRGIRIGYPVPNSPSVDLDIPCEVPAWAVEALVLNGACRIASGKGKALSQQTMAGAKQAYDAMCIHLAHPGTVQIANMPSGAGNKPWQWGADAAFIPPPTITNTDTAHSGEGPF